MKEHRIYCSANEPQRVIFPENNEAFLEFKDFEKQLRVPFVIYADFETFNRKIHSCDPNPENSNTTTKTLLEPCGYGYKVVCTDSNYTKPKVIYRGSNASKKLIECLVEEQKDIEQILQTIEPIPMTKEDEESFRTATHCCLCHKVFAVNETKVKHHLHFHKASDKRSNFMCASHNRCNLNCKQATFVPVIFHNLKNFDGHILCQSIGLFKETEIKCIPQTFEHYISFSLGNLRFIDSFQFLTSSLETLVENLESDGHDNFDDFPREFYEDHAKLLLRKGVYPYNYMDSADRFQEKKLPSIQAFHSNIKGESISVSDYVHATEVFNTFKLKDLGEYHDLYLKTDVVLLCDVFEHFRNMCMQQYGLDPCNYYSSPGLSWSACLKKSCACLELLTDSDMLNFIEKGLRGGISFIANPYTEANNPLLGEQHYDSTKPTSHLQYLDMNNLYGYAMAQKLPTGLFRFLDEEEMEEFNINSKAKDGSKGYILEVSLTYPEQLHDLHSDYPLAP